MDNVLPLDYRLKKFKFFKMTKIFLKSRYDPKNKIKSPTLLPKFNSSTISPSNLQSFKQKFLSGYGFVVCKSFKSA